MRRCRETWYRTLWGVISPVTVIGESEKFVEVEGYAEVLRRCAKVSRTDSYYPTWAQAWNSLYTDVKKKLTAAEKRMNELRKRLAKINRMTKPK